ncbi:MAG: 4'-phosphopantetheinyl transferase superfamily protein [Ruminococcaceae bacterium]|nr:4'-phosphopantetheinyl transferase superfamily protein [Oscillospiraceae bacterium]
MKWYKYDIRNLTDVEYQKWYSLMSEEKQQRVDRFRFEDDKKRTVTGEMLVRKAISEWCGVTPESITFGKKEHGKPYASGLAVEFNISHSGDMVVCVVDNEPIGIDVEKIRPIDLSVAKQFCSEHELVYLFGRIPTEKDFVYASEKTVLTRFFEIWTKKEAYYKCSDMGGLTKVIVQDVLTTNMITFVDDNYVITIYPKETKENVSCN